MKNLTILIAMLMATSAWGVSEDLTALECIEIENWKQTERYQKGTETYYGFFEDEYEH
jgi:hypothetical protein